MVNTSVLSLVSIQLSSRPTGTRVSSVHHPLRVSPVSLSRARSICASSDDVMGGLAGFSESRQRGFNALAGLVASVHPGATLVRRPGSLVTGFADVLN